MPFFLCIVYLYLFVTYNLRIVLIQPECLLEGGLLLMREGKPFFFCRPFSDNIILSHNQPGSVMT